MAKDRIYGLDNLRATMMLLGIVIHSSAFYSTKFFNNITFFTDHKSNNLFFDILEDFIHSFRMPLFFILSGYFTCLLFTYSTPQKALLNRFKRIVLPFIASFFVLFPIHLFLNFLFVATTKLSKQPYYDALENTIKFLNFDSANAMHLWFLYYLIIYTIIFYFINYILRKWFNNVLKKSILYFHSLLENKITILIFPLLTFCYLAYNKIIYFNTSHLFYINNESFLNYLLFFNFGLLLFRKRTKLITIKKNATLFFSIALLLFFTRWIVLLNFTLYNKYIAMVLYALIVWFLIFGFLGVFLKHFNSRNEKTKFISDASYFIYLIHLSIVVYFQTVLIPYNLSPFVKFSIVVVCAFFIPILLYKYFVRSTFIGVFLNGKKL